MSEPTKKRPGLSAVMPAYNEEANVGRAIEAVRAAIEPWFDRIEVIVVDDGSRDRTADEVRKASEADPRVRLVQHPKNRGYGAAVTSGLRAAELPLVFYTDADLQFDPRQITALLARADEAPIVVGYRRNRQDPWHRKLNAWAWNVLQWAFFGLSIRDIDCAFKLLRREVIQSVDLAAEGAFFSTELLLRAKAKGFAIVEVPVDHFPRQAGAPTGARLGVIARAFVEMWRLRRELR